MEQHNMRFAEIEEIEDAKMEQDNMRFGEIEEIEDDVEKRFKLFKKFDLIRDPPRDHHFLMTQYNCSSTKRVMSGWASQKIEQELSLLQENLPDSILVRAYKERIDLMRAVIIGPENTSYCYGLFFFDIYFPRNYPFSPPRLHYHSYGFDLNNPNLSPGGKVRLGLLGTANNGSFDMLDWYGSGDKETWNPKQSSVLDVLNVIRDVTLNNSTCYANDESMIRYSKKALVMTCREMMHVLRAPPLGFEDFVAGHFRHRAHPILLNYRMCMDDSDEMLSLFLKLCKEFEMNGTYCKHHLGHLKVISKPTNTQEKRSRNISSNTNGYLMKMVSKLKNLNALLN